MKREEAIEVIKKNWPDSSFTMLREALETLIPELKESEDERICGKLIAFLKQCKAVYGDVFNQFGLDIDKALAWLEKQGEQKPAEKAAKYKAGDWVVTDKNNAVHIKAVENGKYVLENTMSFTIDYVDKCWRKWIIQDAKDGDVLAVENVIFIYKRTLANHIVSYCKLINDVFESTSDARTCCEGNSFVHPATKEQRGLLFQKMKEAGYEWDAEKKKLKKVKKEPADKIESFDKYEGLTDFERTLADICIGWIGQELGWKQYIKDNADVLLKIAIKKFNSIQDAHFEQNPAWSEEDEKKLDTISRILITDNAERILKIDGYTMVDIAKWLKALKDRCTKKPIEDHYELEEFAKIVRGNLTGISKAVQKLFEAKYLQLTSNKMYGGFKD